MDVYTLPELPYDYAALEPHISGKIMELHHDKHHAAYVAGANAALEALAAAREHGLAVFHVRRAYAADGSEICFNRGKTYLAIVDDDEWQNFNYQ